MPDRRQHRSAAPGDRERLGPTALPRLRAAVQELSWLLGRGYAERSALALVGDRHELDARQRQAVLRGAASDETCAALVARRVAPWALRGRVVAIDGFNVLVTIETALGGGPVLRARDGCARDLSGVRGTWRRTAETGAAIERLGRHLEACAPARCTWILDAGVSNRGRLRTALLATARERGWPWEVQCPRDADAQLVTVEAVVASADREVLARCAAWTDLACETIEESVPQAWWVDLGVE